MLNVTKKTDGDCLTAAVEGRLNSLTAPQFSSEINASLDGINTLILDCEKLEYMSSAGLRTFLILHQQMAEKGGMKIIRVNNPTIREILDMTGFSGILTIE